MNKNKKYRNENGLTFPVYALFELSDYASINFTDLTCKITLGDNNHSDNLPSPVRATWRTYGCTCARCPSSGRCSHTRRGARAKGCCCLCPRLSSRLRSHSLWTGLERRPRPSKWAVWSTRCTQAAFSPMPLSLGYSSLPSAPPAARGRCRATSRDVLPRSAVGCWRPSAPAHARPARGSHWACARWRGGGDRRWRPRPERRVPTGGRWTGTSGER